MFQLRNVTRQFGKKKAVDSVTFDIAQGQMVGVIGRSGAGKSTLLRMINRLVDPSSGSIEFGGIKVSSLKGSALRHWQRDCAMIFQQFNLVPRLDVLTNVLIGRVSYHATLPAVFKRFTEAERALAVRALERMDLLAQAFQRADTLSGGQQQRVAIARALVQEPAVLLADEPVASLDPRNAARVMDLLAAINREEGITLVCNLHSLDIARRYCDRIVALDSGRVAFDGPPASLTADRVAAIYGVAPSDESGLDTFDHDTLPLIAEGAAR